LGAATWINNWPGGFWVFLVGILSFLLVLFFWFSDAVRESETGLNSTRVDISYRWSMSWFIFSEVMFFAAFFGALWYTREIATPLLSDLDHRALLWPDFTGTWPNQGPAGTVAPFQTVGPLWLPTINTALLLTSGVTLTIAHHALRASKRSSAIFLAVHDGCAGLCLRGLPGLRIHARLRRAEPEVHFRRLRGLVLHVDGLSRFFT